MPKLDLPSQFHPGDQAPPMKYKYFSTVLRIHLILMRIRILKKEDPVRIQDSGHLGFESELFYCSIWFIFCPLDLQIFADPNLGSQNLIDLADPDPKHCFSINMTKITDE